MSEDNTNAQEETKPEEEQLLQDNDDTTLTLSEDHSDVLVENGDNGENVEEDTGDENKTAEEDQEVKHSDGNVKEEDDDQGQDLGEEDEEEDEKDDDDEDEDEEDEPEEKTKFDPNVMPQVNVSVLAKRKWQVKVYPLKPADFTSGMVSKVFKAARESLLYLMTGPQSRGKGEMYIQNVAESVNVVKGLMMLDSHFQEINIEVLRKNNEGAIQEKAYMRFDTKMVRLLFVGPTGPYERRRIETKFGKKRERLIGSVFVKNLPPGTSKQMLRVMFPFAQEINYNPEKYSEGTARLVLKTRSTVIPCLKAFAKVELGGNILELHPLEKKRHGPPRPRDSDNERRSSSQKKENDKEGSETSAKPGPASKTRKTDSGDKDASDKDSSKKDSGTKKEGASKTDKDKKSSDRPNKPPYKKFDHKSDRERRPERGGFGSRRGGVSGSRFLGTKRGSGRGSFNSRSTFGSGVRRGGIGRNFQDRAALGVTTELAAKVEATKDMMVLQNQLNMAIKGQLAMLNQTKQAVQEAKIGLATSTSRSMRQSDLDRDYLDERRSRALDSDYGYASKRTASQASLIDDYDVFDRKRSSLSGSYNIGSRTETSGLSRGGRGRGRRGKAFRDAQKSRIGDIVSDRVSARSLASERSMAERSLAQRSLTQQSRSQSRGGYDDDLYRQDSFSLRDQLDDNYGYGGTESRYSGTSRLNTVRGSSAYDDTYRYRY